MARPRSAFSPAITSHLLLLLKYVHTSAPQRRRSTLRPHFTTCDYLSSHSSRHQHDSSTTSTRLIHDISTTPPQHQHDATTILRGKLFVHSRHSLLEPLMCSTGASRGSVHVRPPNQATPARFMPLSCWTDSVGSIEYEELGSRSVDFATTPTESRLISMVALCGTHRCV